MVGVTEAPAGELAMRTLLENVGAILTDPQVQPRAYGELCNSRPVIAKVLTRALQRQQSDAPVSNASLPYGNTVKDFRTANDAAWRWMREHPSSHAARRAGKPCDTA
jgi:hypothetical protein